MLTPFEAYLVSKGFKRTKDGIEDKEDYVSTFVSSYGPIRYNFKKDGISFYWGLSERHKPPVMFLGFNKMFVSQPNDGERTPEDGYRILFSKCGADRFDEIFDVATSENKYFFIHCMDEKNIRIEIHN